MVISTHGGDEPEAIRAALAAGVGFVGVVCSRTRGEALLAELDLTAEQHARVHLHVGLDIGARTAPEIALSILAEIVRQIRVEGLAASPVRERLLPPVQAIDPVCGMTVTVGPDTVHAVVAGSGPLVLHAGMPRPFPGRPCGGPRFVTVAAVVLAAGASRRLGQPKQVLPLDGATVLGATLSVALESGCEPVVVVLGGAADEVRSEVDLAGVDVVENREFGEGCATSVRTAVGALPKEVQGVVLLLGDQPRVRVETIQELEATARGHAVGVCEYDDGLGHPLWFDREMFAALEAMHGDKAVWKLVDAEDRTPTSSGSASRGRAARHRHVGRLRGDARGAAVTTLPLASAEQVRARFDEHDYLADAGMSTAVFLSLRLGMPLLLEGEPGVGKTAAAQVLARGTRRTSGAVAVLRGPERRRGALRLELPAAAPRDPAGGVAR